VADDENFDTTEGSTSAEGAHGAGDAAGDETDTDAGADAGAEGQGAGKAGAEGNDLRGILRQLTAPMIESLDTRLRDQVEVHVDELLGPKVDAAIADRLQTIDRAIAGLSRALAELEQRVTSLEGGAETLED